MNHDWVQEASGCHWYLFSIVVPAVRDHRWGREGALLVWWRVNLVVTVLHCNWGYSARCNLQQEGSNTWRNEGGCVMWGEESGAAMRKSRHMWFKSHRATWQEEWMCTGKTMRKMKKKKIKWLNKAKVTTYETRTYHLPQEMVWLVDWLLE